MAMRSNDKPPEHAIGRPAHPVKHAESAAHLTSAAPVQVSVTKRYKAYYPPREVQHRVKINSLAPSTSRSAVIEPGTGRKVLSDARVEAQRQLACGFIERVGMRMGFPRRSIATAQTLYNRFHLHFQLKDFPYQDVAVAALLVAAKVQDTLKKLREIQIAAWQVQNIIEGGTGIGEGDLTAQEAHRPVLIGIERLLLQTICFNFNPLRPALPESEDGVPAAAVSLLSDLPPTGKDAFVWVLQLSKALGASKRFTYLAHLVTIDVHRTLAPLSYPPHTCATAAIFLASFMWKRHTNARSWMDEEAQPAEDKARDASDQGPDLFEGWLEELESAEEDIHEISHAVLDLFTQLCPPPAHTTNGTTVANYAGPSPSFAGPSPTSLLASPIDSMAMTTAFPVRATATQSEKDRHLLATGVPHTLGLAWSGKLDAFPSASDASATETGAAVAAGWSAAATSVFAPASEGDFLKIKIRLRELESARVDKRSKRIIGGDDEMRQSDASGGSKRPRNGVAPPDVRWVGEDDLARDLDEAWKESEDREREKAERKAAKETAPGDAEPEGEAQSKKPTSVRYMF